MRADAPAPIFPRELAGLKIWFLAGTLEHGGAERQLFYWLRTLGQCGASASVLSLDQGEFWEGAIRELGVPVSWVGQEQSRLKRLIRITRQLRKAPPDLVQSQHFFANGYLGIAGRILGLTSIGGIRNDGATEVRGSGRIGGQLNLRLPRMLAANSRRGYCYAISQGIPASRLYFLPNVIDTERFTPAVVASRTPVTLLTVGRLVPQKRLDRFLLILSRLRRDLNLKVTGLIVGPSRANDNLRARLEKQAGQLGLGPHALQFSGAESEMVRIYQQASVVLLTSDHEGTPNVLLEAMACGLPVVATRVGGVPEIVRDGQTGFLRDRDDLDGLVTATAQLVTDSELRVRMGQSARAFVEENHSLERLPARLGELYRLALPKGRTHSATCNC
jgi:glycosyltransferase involved in cell wall biosynthesis